MTQPNPSAPTWAEILRRSRLALKRELRTMIPASVQRFSPDDQTVDAQPLIKRVRVVDGEEVVDNYPQITRIPVQYPRWGGFVFRMPLKKGDIVCLQASDRELERWLSIGSGANQAAPVEPRGDRTHSSDDVVATPGIAPWSQPVAGLGDGDLWIGREDGKGGVRVKPDGSVFLGGDPEGAQLAVARLTDQTLSNSGTDLLFWNWVTGLDVALRALIKALVADASAGTLVTAAPTTAQGIAGVESALNTAAPAPPVQQVGKINQGSSKVSTE